MAVDFSIKKNGNGRVEQPAATDDVERRIWWSADKTAII